MNDKLKAHLYAFITVVLWGSGFPFTRLVGDAVSPYCLSMLRCVISAVILILLGKIFKIRKPFCKKDLLWFALSGFFGFSGYYVLYNLGMQTVTAATGSIISAALCPILTAVAAIKLYDERINLIGWAAMFASAVGVVILVLGEGDTVSFGMGIVWVILSTVVFVGYNLLNRTLSEKGYTAIEIVTYSVIMSAIQLLVFVPQSIDEIGNIDITIGAAILYLGVMPNAVAYYTWGKAFMLAERTSQISNYMFLMPIVATIVAVFMIHEIPGAGTLLGGVIILASMVIFEKKGTPDRLS